MKERVKQLCKEKGVSMNIAESEMGLAKGYISKLGKSNPNQKTLQKMSDYFGVSVGYLMYGEDESEKELSLKPKDQKDINEILANTEQLLKQDGLMFDGDPASPEAIDSILSAMQVGMEMAKKKNKEKYTPKKYKKD